MKIFLLIIGLVFTALGLWLTGQSWYAASVEGRIVEGLAYSGPVFLVIGVWRIFSSLAAIRPPSIFRIIAVGVGIAAGFGNTSALKAVYPADQDISSTKTQ